MTASPATIVAFASTDKVPGFVGEVVYGTGAVSASALPTNLLLVGYKLDAGIAVADQDVVDIRSSDDADLWFGAGSELARMCYKALLTPGVTLKAQAVSTPASPTAATATITIAGTWSVGGSWSYRIDGEIVTGGISTTDTPTAVAAGIVEAITNRPRLSVTAAPGAAGVVTLTRKNPGDRGNLGTLFQDKSKLPTGLTSTLAGGTAMPGGGVHFTGGAGVEAPALSIANLHAGQYDYVALATNTTGTITPAGFWQEAIQSKTSPLEGRPSFVLIGFTGTLAAATTLTTTGINDAMWQLLWMANGEVMPGELAASFGAERQTKEHVDPAAGYDGTIVRGIAPHSFRGDSPSRSTQLSALNAGITPLVSTPDGKVAVVRSITTRCRTNGLPDYRTLDTSEAVVPQFIRKDVGLLWETSFRQANPRVSDDAVGGAKRPAGVATPSLWNAYVTNLLKGHEAGFGGAPPIIIDVDQNLPTSGYDPVARRIMTLLPVVVAPTQHQIGVSIRQVAALAPGAAAGCAAAAPVFLIR